MSDDSSKNDPGQLIARGIDMLSRYPGLRYQRRVFISATHDPRPAGGNLNGDTILALQQNLQNAGFIVLNPVEMRDQLAKDHQVWERLEHLILTADYFICLADCIPGSNVGAKPPPKVRQILNSKGDAVDFTPKTICQWEFATAVTAAQAVGFPKIHIYRVREGLDPGFILQPRPPFKIDPKSQDVPEQTGKAYSTGSPSFRRLFKAVSKLNPAYAMVKGEWPLIREEDGTARLKSQRKFLGVLDNLASYTAGTWSAELPVDALQGILDSEFLHGEGRIFGPDSRLERRWLELHEERGLRHLRIAVGCDSVQTVPETVNLAEYLEGTHYTPVTFQIPEDSASARIHPQADIARLGSMHYELFLRQRDFEEQLRLLEDSELLRKIEESSDHEALLEQMGRTYGCGESELATYLEKSQRDIEEYRKTLEERFRSPDPAKRTDVADIVKSAEFKLTEVSKRMGTACAEFSKHDDQQVGLLLNRFHALHAPHLSPNTNSQTESVTLNVGVILKELGELKNATAIPPEDLETEEERNRREALQAMLAKLECDFRRYLELQILVDLKIDPLVKEADKMIPFIAACHLAKDVAACDIAILLISNPNPISDASESQRSEKDGKGDRQFEVARIHSWLLRVSVDRVLKDTQASVIVKQKGLEERIRLRQLELTRLARDAHEKGSREKSLLELEKWSSDLRELGKQNKASGHQRWVGSAPRQFMCAKALDLLLNARQQALPDPRQELLKDRKSRESLGQELVGAVRAISPMTWFFSSSALNEEKERPRIVAAATGMLFWLTLLSWIVLLSLAASGAATTFSWNQNTSHSLKAILIAVPLLLAMALALAFPAIALPKFGIRIATFTRFFLVSSSALLAWTGLTAVIRTGIFRVSPGSSVTDPPKEPQPLEVKINGLEFSGVDKTFIEDQFTKLSEAIANVSLKSPDVPNYTDQMKSIAESLDALAAASVTVNEEGKEQTIARLQLEILRQTNLIQEHLKGPSPIAVQIEGYQQLIQRLDLIGAELRKTDPASNAPTPHYYLLAEGKECHLPHLGVKIAADNIAKNGVSGVSVSSLKDSASAEPIGHWPFIPFATDKSFSSDGKTLTIRFTSMVDRFGWLSNYSLVEILTTPIGADETKSKVRPR